MVDSNLVLYLFIHKITKVLESYIFFVYLTWSNLSCSSRFLLSDFPDIFYVSVTMMIGKSA